MTALQLASAVSAVANGGTLMRPTIVRQVEDREGRVIRTTRPGVVRRVLEPATVDALTALLEGVVENGTGRLAAIPGYRVAGKTGTAQKIDASGRYSMIDHVASFVGYVPATRPALVILVSLDTPRGPKNQGGDVARAAVRAHRGAGAAAPGRSLGRSRRASCARRRRPRRR